MATKYGKLLTSQMKDFYPKINITLSICGHKKSPGKLKPLYHQFHQAYDHQICQGSDILLRDPIQWFAWPLIEMVL